MKYDPQVHDRRSIRLPGYDYSQPGAYFVTICTHNRDLLLRTEPVQEAVRSTWEAIPQRFRAVTLDEFVVMPNHVHGIIILGDATGAASGAPTLGAIIRAFKSISAIQSSRILNRSGLPFWQRNYYEHVIRDEDELNIIRQYICDNPRNWLDDPDNPSNL